MAIISISDSQINSADQVLVADASSKIPAKDGSQITILNATNVSAGTIATARLDTGTTANKIVVLDGSGNLPVVDGSLLTGVVSATVSASDPTISTNPSGGVGTEWNNSTSGEMYICTDATAGANVWTNVGAGSGDIQPIPTFFGLGTQYGHYHGGGSTTAPTWTQNTINKFSFTSDGNATDRGDLSVARYHISSASSSTYGYSVGGMMSGPPNGHTDIIDKYAFANSANATDVGNLIRAQGYVASGTNSESYGYAAGGTMDPPGNDDTIQKFAFASDGNASDVGNLIEALYFLSGHTSEDYGYASGGRTGSTYYTRIQKFAFASDGNSTDQGDLLTGSAADAGTQSATHGYRSQNTNATPADGVTIQKFAFASAANATDVGDLAQACYQSQSQGCSAVGFCYNLGGNGAAGNSYGSYDYIQKWSTTSDGNATDIGNLTISQMYGGGTND